MSWHFSVVETPAALHLFKGDMRPRMEQIARNFLEQEANIQIKMFRQTTSYWRHKPVFDYKIEMFGDTMQLSVFTDDEIYFYIDRGTSVRFATMHPDFRSKTTPGSRKSGRGHGPYDPVFVSKKVPRPGIEARHFTDMIFDERRPVFIQRLTRLLLNEARRYWSGQFGH